LFWVHANRRTVSFVSTIGTSIRSVVEGACAASQRRGEFEKVVDSVVDDEFRRHCRVVGRRGSGLVIHVDKPALVYAMRLRWSVALRDACRRVNGSARVNGIVFEFAHE